MIAAFGILLIVLIAAFVVGGFLIVTGLWARTAAAFTDLWHTRR